MKKQPYILKGLKKNNSKSLSGFRERVCLNSMKQLQTITTLAKNCLRILSLIVIMFIPVTHFGQPSSGWKLEKMPADLETDFALSSLPLYVQKNATVYLLDPEKGYYIGRRGTNGFICFVIRTEWEQAEFRDDIATPISFDAEGAKTIFPVYADEATMRASGKFTPAQIKDTMTERYNKGYYKAPSRSGISFMLAPVMRVYDGPSSTVITMNMPHYMFYAPYVKESDIGGNSPSGGLMILGDGKGPHGYIILPAGKTEKAKIINENKDLLKRLIKYKAYFETNPGRMHH